MGVSTQQKSEQIVFLLHPNTQKVQKNAIYINTIY